MNLCEKSNLYGHGKLILTKISWLKREPAFVNNKLLRKACQRFFLYSFILYFFFVVSALESVLFVAEVVFVVLERVVSFSFSSS